MAGSAAQRVEHRQQLRDVRRVLRAAAPLPGAEREGVDDGLHRREDGALAVLWEPQEAGEKLEGLAPQRGFPGGRMLRAHSPASRL